jgi:hypothetical protein
MLPLEVDLPLPRLELGKLTGDIPPASSLGVPFNFSLSILDSSCRIT